MNHDHKSVITLSPSATGADAVRCGGYLYTAGVGAVDERGNVVAPGDLAAQAAHIYRRLGGILQAADASWSDVVKVNSYVAPEVNSAADRRIVNDAHKAFLRPGQAAALAAPLPQPVEGSLLQIELIARPGAKKQPIAVAGVPVAADFAAAVRADDTLYVGGRLPLAAPIPLAGPALRIEGELGAQTAAIYAHHDRVLHAAGLPWSDAVQVHQFLTPRRLSIDEFQRARHRYLTPGRYLSTSVACESNFSDWPLDNVLILADMEADARPRTEVHAREAWGNKPGPQAWWSGPLLRMHGQVARNLEAKTQHEGDIAGQTRLVFDNLDAVLRTAGIGWGEVVHMRSFCKHRTDIAITRTLRERYLAPRSCAITDLVADYFDPLLLLEVELVAVRPAP